MHKGHAGAPAKAEGRVVIENLSQVPPAPWRRREVPGLTGRSPSLLRRQLDFLRHYRPLLRDVHFWIIQFMVVFLSLAPLVFEPMLAPRWAPIQVFGLSMIFISLHLIPVLHAGVRFGAGGAIAASVASIILSLPHAMLTDFVIIHTVVEVPAQLVQLSLFVAAAVVVAHRIEREHRAQADLRDYAARLVTSAEEERSKLSREIHDDVVQRMGLLRLSLDTLKPAVSGCPTNGAAIALREASTLAEGVAQTLRLFSRSLRPQALEDLGLVASVRQIMTDIAKRNTSEWKMEVTGEERALPPDVELAVFRIAQEALRNAERHARASRVSLTIAYGPETVHISVVDNGAGFAPPSGTPRFSPTGQMGLLGMQERAISIGATLQIDSAPGRGTRVALSARADGSPTARVRLSPLPSAR